MLLKPSGAAALLSGPEAWGGGAGAQTGCSLAVAVAADRDRWRHPGLNYKSSLARLLSSILTSAVPPSEAPLQAADAGLLLGRLIR